MILIVYVFKLCSLYFVQDTLRLQYKYPSLYDIKKVVTDILSFFRISHVHCVETIS
jgi:hypothetical protein